MTETRRAPAAAVGDGAGAARLLCLLLERERRRHPVARLEEALGPKRHGRLHRRVGVDLGVRAQLDGARQQHEE